MTVNYEEVAINFGEIVRVLKKNYPKTLDLVLTDIDLSEESVCEYLDSIGMNTND